MISAAPRSTGQATLITGFLGSGKTWSLTNQLLQAARSSESSPRHEEASSGSGSLLALSTRQADCAALRQRIDLDRPLGCTKCDAVTFPSLVRTIVNDFGPTIGSYPSVDARVLDRSALSVFLHRNLDALPLGKYRPLHDPGNAVRPLLDLFSSLAHCGVSPEEYLGYVETLETELLEIPAAGREGLVVNDKAAAVSSEPTATATATAVAVASRARLRAELEAEGWRAHLAGERDKANSYEAFVALKRREGVADYSDHLLLARRVLKESPSAKAALSLRLSHIYVDDLQEYSPAMVGVLADLVAPGVGITAAIDPFLAATSSNFPAGHVLGAEHSAMARFKAAFPDAMEMPLVGNRHSTDAIQVAMEALKPRDTPVGAKDKKNNKKAAAAASQAAGDAAAAADSPAAATSAVVVGHAPSAAPDETPASASSAAASEQAAAVEVRGSRLTCLTFQTEEDEVSALGRRVRRLIDGGVSPGDIGVAAVGGWGVADSLVAAVSAVGVPVEGPTRFSSVFDSETPRMLMSFLRCLVHPSESTPLLHLLMTCPAYALPAGELTSALEGHLSRYVPLRSFLQTSHLGEGQDTDPRGGENGVSANARSTAGRLLSDVNRFAESAKRKGVREIMRDFLRYTGQLERLEEPTTTEEEKQGRSVAELFELAVKAEKQAGGDNVALVEPVLRLYRRHGTGYMDSSRFAHDETTTDNGKSETRGGPSSCGGGAVRIFQPGKDWEGGDHRFFDTVFIPFCTRGRLPGNLRTARLPVPGPFYGAPEPRDSASLRSQADLARAGHENRARAMLYVALGYARREVCLSVSASVRRGKTHLNPSPFLREILEEDAPLEWKATIASSEKEGQEEPDRLDGVADGGRGDLDVVPKHSVNGEGGGGVTDVRLFVPPPPPPPAPLRLSFSSISSFAACPHSYYLQHVLNVSPPPNPRMVYGRAMHESVAAVLRYVVNGGGSGGDSGGGGPPPTLEAVVEEFNLHFGGCAFESAVQVRTLRAAGVAGLEAFMSRLIEGGCVVGGHGRGDGAAGSSGDAQLLVERKFMVKVPEANVILSGIFDRVDIDLPSASAGVGGGASRPALLSITDYKSNVGEKDPKRMVRDNLQLRVYALAAEKLFGFFPTELAIESIEDGRRGAVVPSPADADIAMEAISKTAAAVRAESFDATPSFQACTFCGFKHMCQHSVITSAAL
ncbi:unnamed protein product [Pylaiella littoralis]